MWDDSASDAYNTDKISGYLLRYNESLDEVEQRVVDDYRKKHQDNEELRTFSDREILQMCPPSIHDYDVFYDRKIAPLQKDLKQEKEDLAENEFQAARKDIEYWQREEYQRDAQANRHAIAEINERIALIMEEKARRTAKFLIQEYQQR